MCDGGAHTDRGRVLFVYKYSRKQKGGERDGHVGKRPKNLTVRIQNDKTPFLWGGKSHKVHFHKSVGLAGAGSTHARYEYLNNAAAASRVPPFPIRRELNAKQPDR